MAQKKKILVTGRLPDEIMAQLSAACDMEANREDRPMEREQVLTRIADREGLLSMITDRVDAELMDRAPNLKIISNLAVGYNNIDVAAATARGIAVTNTPGVTTEPTADLTLGLILAVARRIVEEDRLTREGKFQYWAPMLFLGRSVARKTLGIVGFGAIGQAVAKRARGFDMRILYNRRRRLDEARERELGIEYADFGRLLRESDFVSLHVPLTDETRHLVGAKELRQMKPTAFLINASRGPVVHEKDLVEALRMGVIAGAGLDVYENEPALAPGLTELPNVVLTPHVGSGTIEDRTLMARMATENLLAGLKGEVPRFILNPDVFKNQKE
ncbi:MAG: 2-hydroxyacid dehydrogenase [Syntrophaceae bacterium]